jgi:protein-disulfide isomerase
VLRGYAQAMGLDLAAWDQCYDGRKHVDRIAAHAQAAERAQVRSTPTFVVGTRMVQGSQPFDVIKALVDSARATAGAAPAAGAPAAGAPAPPAGTQR